MKFDVESNAGNKGDWEAWRDGLFEICALGDESERGSERVRSDHRHRTFYIF